MILTVILLFVAFVLGYAVAFLVPEEMELELPWFKNWFFAAAIFFAILAPVAYLMLGWLASLQALLGLDFVAGTLLRRQTS